MTVHHGLVVALAAVLVGLAALSPSTRVQAQQPVSELPLDELRALAAEGDAEAQDALGFMYAHGRRVGRAYAQAVRWYRLAAEQGHASGQFHLGLMYLNGQGVSQDNMEAHMWFTLAVEQSSGEERERYVQHSDLTSELMTADQVAEAQRRAREWTPTPEP